MSHARSNKQERGSRAGCSPRPAKGRHSGRGGHADRRRRPLDVTGMGRAMAGYGSIRKQLNRVTLAECAFVETETNASSHHEDVSVHISTKLGAVVIGTGSVFKESLSRGFKSVHLHREGSPGSMREAAARIADNRPRARPFCVNSASEAYFE